MTSTYGSSLRNKHREYISNHITEEPKYNLSATAASTAVYNESTNTITAEVTPDRPQKQPKEKTNSEDLTIKQESEILSSPGRTGSGLFDHRNSNHTVGLLTSPSNYHPNCNRLFPSTPQYNQIYATDLNRNSDNPRSPSVSEVNDSPLKRVRLSDNVVVPSKKIQYHEHNPDLFSRSMSRSTPKSQTQGAYLHPRPVGGASYSQFGGILPSPHSFGGGEKHNPEKPHEELQHKARVIGNESEVEVVLKSAPSANTPPNRISSATSSPDRPSRRGPYTQMTRGDFSDRRENVAIEAGTSQLVGIGNGERKHDDEQVPSLRNKNLGKKVKSPPRSGARTVDGGGNVNPVSPEEGHVRSPSFNNMFGEFPSGATPESAYNNQRAHDSPYPNSNPSALNPPRTYFKYPPSSPVKSSTPPLQQHSKTSITPTPSKAAHGSSYGFPSTTDAGSAALAPPNYYNSYPPPYSQGALSEGYYSEEVYRGDGASTRSSPGKRQRVTESADKKKPPTTATSSYRYPNPPYSGPNPNQRQHHTHTRTHYSMGEQNQPTVTESFDSETHYPRMPGSVGAGGRTTAPSVLKASSYPPPPSPRTSGPTSGSSASSYPGTVGRAGTAATTFSQNDGRTEVGYGSSLAHPMPYRADYYYGSEQILHPTGRMVEYPPPPADSLYYPPQPQGTGGGGGVEYYDEYYYHNSPQQSHQHHETPEVHPLLREYDPDRDKRITSNSNANNCSPVRPSPSSSAKPKGKAKKPKGTVASTVGREAASASSSPEHRKPSTAAHAAIAAGMTLPPSAQEVDFDIHNPPMKPVVQHSDKPVCSISSNVNAHDVLCGRGGGTNTQIGNRRFRALVQEFQPIYLLCRRKEKPLIARTIVLIIRNRGGRFLKKDELSGMLFEVGDEKAEAKTSQALREGLDVRASKGSSSCSDSKRRSRKKKSPVRNNSSSNCNQNHHHHKTLKSEPYPYGEDITMADHTTREGPPPHHEGYPYPYYYGGGTYDDYYHGTAVPGGGSGAPYDHHDAHYTTSRKRQRPPPSSGGIYRYPSSTPPFKSPPVVMGASYAYSHSHHMPRLNKPASAHAHKVTAHHPGQHEYYPVPPQGAGEEDQSVWDMDFSPPRRGLKRESVGGEVSGNVGVRGVEEGQVGYHVQDRQT